MGYVFDKEFANDRAQINHNLGGLAMSRLLDVKWNEHAFEKLVLDENKKMLVHSLVKHHSGSNDEFDDIISGKGKGIIGLLSGPPGCGKTLTVEAVAEDTRRPLYNVSAGEIGIAPSDIDKNLTGVLDLAQKWDAIVLIDEADVFLQQRDANDVKRNALVSIFLRQIEYFQGIMMLTTNQIGLCDAAFESRIHLAIHYQELNEAGRFQVWKGFLFKAMATEAAGQSGISHDEVVTLSKIQINGRRVSPSPVVLLTYRADLAMRLKTSSVEHRWLLKRAKRNCNCPTLSG
jgi:SpoVK/Ycf46/Vps4 family AAA+-type ATPase